MSCKLIDRRKEMQSKFNVGEKKNRKEDKKTNMLKYLHLVKGKSEF